MIIKGNRVLNTKFNESLNTSEGRFFIYQVIDFFVRRSIDKVKNSIFKPLEEDKSIRLYERYKFIYSTKDKADIELCYMLAETASEYIEYIEDGFNPDLQFPFDCDYLFNLFSWFEEINIRHRFTYEILILLINKLYNSPYAKFF